MTSAFPEVLEQLLNSPVFGHGPGRVPPPRSHGVYLFSEGRRPLYVGRCGLTERARRAGAGFSNFRTRLAGHTRPSARHFEAAFAWRLACEDAEGQGLELPPGRSERERDPIFAALFVAAKQRVTDMEFRVVEIDDDPMAYAFELYAAFVLDTPYNSFATS